MCLQEKNMHVRHRENPVFFLLSWRVLETYSAYSGEITWVGWDVVDSFNYIYIHKLVSA